MVYKMDQIGSTNKIYISIYKSSAALFVAIVQIYLIALAMGFDIYQFSWIENKILRLLIAIVFQVVLAGVGYIFIFFLVMKMKTCIWIKKNKNIYVRGTWLHIHIKDNIRIGDVVIQQNFYTISAKAHNITPQENEMYYIDNQTEWRYYLGKVAQDESARDFIGCYSAVKQSSGDINDGIHVLTIHCDEHGYPSQMIGKFSDTFQVNRSITNIDVGEHRGDLLLFRISEDLSKYLTEKHGLNYRLLSTIHKNDKFKNEPFVRELCEIMKNKQYTMSNEGMVPAELLAHRKD